MANPAADEARALDDRRLAEEINEAYRERFNLQFQKGTRQLQDPLAIRRARRRIARLRTIQRERQLAAAAGAPIAPREAPAETVLSPQKRRALEERAVREAEAAAVAAAAEAEAAAAATDDEATDDEATDDEEAALDDLSAEPAEDIPSARDEAGPDATDAVEPEEPADREDEKTE